MKAKSIISISILLGVAQLSAQMRQGDNEIITQQTNEIVDLNTEHVEDKEKLDERFINYNEEIERLENKLKNKDLSNVEKEKVIADLMKTFTKQSADLKKFTKESYETFGRFSDHISTILRELQKNESYDSNAAIQSAKAAALVDVTLENEAAYFKRFLKDLSISEGERVDQLLKSRDLMGRSRKLIEDSKSSMAKDSEKIVNYFQNLATQVVLSRNHYSRLNHAYTRRLERIKRAANYNYTKINSVKVRDNIDNIKLPEIDDARDIFRLYSEYGDSYSNSSDGDKNRSEERQKRIQNIINQNRSSSE